jgi:RNA 3'-terminal phosphate cyclase (ATP)
MIEIDGSYGEGGGQILRTALSLSCLLRKPFRLSDIRKGRKKPGLMPQHLACVRLLTLISDAKAHGAEVGSTEMTFEPGDPVPGDYYFDIGTAGSTSLLLQAVLPPLVFAEAPSRVTLAGGTHVPFSPPYHFISEVFLPTLAGLGIEVAASIERYGFYPKGGGKISVAVQPCRKPAGISLEERGDIVSLTGTSAVGSLPLSIAERQRKSAEAALAGIPVRPGIEIIEADTYSPGTFVFLKAETETCFSGSSSLGERGKRAEAVGEEAARELLRYLETGACIDPHLADQLAVYLCLAGGPSRFTTSRITGHLLTNLAVIRTFLGTRFRIEGEKEKPGRVSIIP